jgi:hypothetical protein
VKRLGLAGVLVAVLASGCATAFVGEPTYVSDTGATANGFIQAPEGEADLAWSPRP